MKPEQLLQDVFLDRNPTLVLKIPLSLRVFTDPL